MSQEKFEKFIREYYYAELDKALGENNALFVDFSILDRFDGVLADELLRTPEPLLKAFNAAAVAIANTEERINVRIFA